jgi:chromosome partitioning protein
MAKILSSVNLKGGVGKTAIAVNFAAYCGRKGLRTLLIDLDPQTNATFSCIGLDKWEEHAKNKGTVADLLDARRHTSAEGSSKNAKDVILKDVFPKVDLIPSHLDLFTIDLDLASATAREFKLKKSLRGIVEEYQIIVCDCPPNLTLPTQNALAFSTHYVVPISPDYLSGIGVGILLRRIRELSEALENDLEHIGIIISRMGRPALHRELNIQAIKSRFENKVLDQYIHERVKVSESAASNKPIYDMNDPEASAEFSAVSQDLLNRMGIKNENT